MLIVGSWLLEYYIRPAEGSDRKNNTSDFYQTDVNGRGSDTLNNEQNTEDLYLDEDKTDEGYMDENLSNVEAPSASNLETDWKEQEECIEAENRIEQESLLESDGVILPKAEFSLKAENDLAEDMIGFFIYQDRSYIQYSTVRNGANFVGKRVGRVNGLIDEWTSTDGYVNGAGTFIGDIYEVEGVSPTFMLCVILDNGVVETYINNNDIILRTGADLIDDRLHLRNTDIKTISFQTEKEYNTSLDEPMVLPEESKELFECFINSFAEHMFVYAEEKSYYPFGQDFDNTDIYHLYFTTETGLVLHFALLGDGYVCFPWLNGVCVQIEQTIYDEVVQILKRSAS